MNGIFNIISDISGATVLTIFMLILLYVLILSKYTRLPVFKMLHKGFNSSVNFVGKIILKRERAYHRDLEIGKIDEKRKKVKLYRFLNDLTIDLGYKNSGVTPYELLFIVVFIVSITSIILCRILFSNVFLAVLVIPIFTVGIFCIMYTKANLAHDTRIEAVITAENIICNNIKVGVVKAVRDNINSIPEQVRPDFVDFVDNVEYKNDHIRTALLELNDKLGGLADDFIKKCIIFELEEEHGIVGMFQDVVEVNTSKMNLRIEMKRKFETVVTAFKASAIMIFIFLGGVIALFPDVRKFYFTNPIGQIIILLDVLLLVAEYVYITKLRAEEL